MNPKPQLPKSLLWKINSPKFSDSENCTSKKLNSSPGLEGLEDLHSIAHQLKQLCVEQEALFRVMTSTPEIWLSPSQKPEGLKEHRNISSDLATETATETTTIEFLHRQNLAIQYLIRQQTLHPNDLLLHLQHISETIAHTLEVERVSLWLRDDELELDVTEPALVEHNPLNSSEPFLCMYQYEPQNSDSDLELYYSCSPQSDSPQPVLNSIKFHFKSQENKTSWRSDSFENLHPRSFNRLDVPIHSTQNTVGFIRVEYTNTSRQWRIEEESFLNCLTDLVTQALERYRRQKFQQKQSQTIEQLQIQLQQKTQQLQVQQAERQKMESQLQEAHHAASEGTRVKHAFLNNISHELRTPLHAIIGYSDLLCEEVTEQSQIDWLSDLQTIRQEGYRLLYRINSILDLVKIETGQVRLTHETFDPMSVVGDVVTQLSEIAQQNQNQLEVDFSQNLGLMQADFARLQQILYNGVENALKLTQMGSVRLNVNRESLADGDWIYFSITHTGGVATSSQEQPHLFETVRQIDDSFSNAFTGTELSLTMSRHLCRLMGGDLTIDSPSGMDLTLTVRLKAGV